MNKFHLKICTHLELSSVLVDETLVGEDVDEGELVPDADLVVVGVVGGGDLDGARAEVHLDHLVPDDRQALAAEGVDDALALEVRVLGVLGLDGHGRVAQHRLDTRRGHHDLLVLGVGDLVREGDDDAELHGLLVAGDGEQGAAGKLLLVD